MVLLNQHQGRDHHCAGFSRPWRQRSSQSARPRASESANFSQSLCGQLVKSRLNGQTRMQIAQSLLSFVQKEKHFSASDVHFLTPWMADRPPPNLGGPSGSALTGQASAHLVHMSQNFATPGRFGRSGSNGISVKIFENRSRGPNSGVMTNWFRAYSPKPACTAMGITKPVSFMEATA